MKTEDRVLHLVDVYDFIDWLDIGHLSDPNEKRYSDVMVSEMLLRYQSARGYVLQRNDYPIMAVKEKENDSKTC